MLHFNSYNSTLRYKIKKKLNYDDGWKWDKSKKINGSFLQ